MKIRTILNLIGAILLAFMIGFAGCDSTNQSESLTSTRTEKLKPIELLSEYATLDQPSLGKFTDLDPSETGINNVHIWNPPPRHRSLIVGTFGNGVAIGDFDNDGWQDIFVGRQHEAGRLYRNLKGMKFEDVTEQVGIDPQGMWCVGTTFADINNDGLLDLYLCGYECDNRLYINNGDKFVESAAEYGLDFNGSSIVMNFADYDLDGDLDGYLVTNFKKPNGPLPKKRQIIRRPGMPPEVAPEFKEVFFLVPHPDGEFRRSKAGQFDYFFRNDSGKFVEATEEVGIGLQPYIGLSSAWWDYNDDGLPDLYVANDFKGPDILYHNNGPNENGEVTFTDVSKLAFPHTPWYSMGSDFADINNDGRLDYLASDMAGTNHYRDKLSMGSMSGPDSNAWFLNAVDPPQYMRNALYLNNGTERFGEVAFLAGLAKTDWTWTVKFSDFDNDGWQDVFFTNGMTRDLFNSDLKNQIEAEIKQARKELGNKARPAQMAMSFWEKQEPYRLENMAFRNTGDLKFKDVSKRWGLDHLGVSLAAAAGDLDNDGDIDLVVNGFEEPVKIYRNDLARQKSIRFKLVGVESNRNGLGTRVEIYWDREGKNEIQSRYASPTRGFMSTSENIIHFGVGDLDTIDKVVVRWPAGRVQTFENLKTNCLYQIAEVDSDESVNDANPTHKPMFRNTKNGWSKFVHAEKDFNDFARQPLLPNKHSQLGPGLAWGDVDGDGKADLFMGGAKGYASRILRNMGSGQFEPIDVDDFESEKYSEDMGALFFDADQDNDLDLYIVSGGVECEPGDDLLKDRLYINDGTGNFSRSPNAIPDLKESGSAVAACDFDQDGDLDLVVGSRIIPGSYPESPTSVLLQNDSGEFKDVTSDLAPQLAKAGMICSLLWSDVDNDDWQDLLVATEWGPVRLFKNESGRLVESTEMAGLGKRLGWFNSICGGDIDNDGDMDFVVGNVGLNTKYKATPEKPELLYYGDFEGVGRRRIVEAKYEDEVCLPRRGLSCSSHAMPMIKEKTPTYHEFAISSLDSLYSEEKLDEATKYEANTLESLVLVNESEGGTPKFTIRELPRIAQASPVFGCQLIDIDGDGNLDLYAVQNFYGPQRETGYFDGGVSVLMLGDGEGQFEAVDTKTSGLLVTGDATSLTVADVNGDSRPDFLVGKNGGALECFENQFGDGNSHLLVKLDQIAEPGKLLTGTKIFSVFSDGSKQLNELRSSEGYLSQSVPELFLGKGKEHQLIKVLIHFPDGAKQTIDVSSSASGQISQK